MNFNKKINVLMITGVYLPDINGAVLQCEQIINNIGYSVNFTVLAGTKFKEIDEFLNFNRFSLIKVLINNNKINRIIGALRYLINLIMLLRQTKIIHIHGFSKRNAIVILIGFLCRKKIILKMTSFGFDDPVSVRRNFSIIYWKLFKLCHAYIGISPAFKISYQKVKLPERKYYFIPNGVNLNRFSPISVNEKIIIRNKYGFNENDKIIIFVGHFSIEKRPMLLYEAWLKICEQKVSTKLIFIGRTKNHFEVDNTIVNTIKQDALQRDVLQHIRFVEVTYQIDEYMKIANIFVLPSTREGLPNVLLEAMACALPCFVTNLSGVTDWLINDNENGILFNTDDPDVWAKRIIPILSQNSIQQKLGLNARGLVENGFSSKITAQRILELYKII
jgi:glycosyltransferase involved in cell wall biosynthesis